MPDRRGRGLSGPFGDVYGMEKEAQDLEALMAGTAAQDVFGLSSGALIALQAALVLPSLGKVALYEPPLVVNDTVSPMTWVARYEKDLARGDLAAAMTSCMHGTGDASPIRVPRFIMVPLMRLAIWVSARDLPSEKVPLDVLVRCIHFDMKLAAEMAGTIESFRTAHAEILLIGGDRSVAYLPLALDALTGVLPRVRRMELPGLGHLAADDVGQPELVAEVLLRFFSEAA